MIQAKELRDKDSLDKIPNDKPGYYKWWAKKKELNELLKGLGTSFTFVAKDIEKNDSLYCIYVGTAIRESLQKRLDWHVNDKHADRAVRNGIVSTLRQSIASIICHNQYDKNGTNSFIDKLYVEWFPVNCIIKSEDAKSKISIKEKKLINQYLRILNIKDNNHTNGQEIKKQLKKLRKESK